MRVTPHHVKYWAHALSLRGTDGIERLGQSLFDAAVDLNPHQIEAAVFALDNPLAEGAILADEVGLGKTIEAGLVLSQLWAEGKRRLLVICPASLRKQWALELEEKFHLPSVVMDARRYRHDQREGVDRPFSQPLVLIASIHFAARHAEDLAAVSWDTVVIDEAHKLRNTWRQSNRLGSALLSALRGRRKLLLTATPLQNSIMELYGLSLFVDEYLFGDPAHFRSVYGGKGAPLADLRQRLKPYVHRTLRKDVLEYVHYTKRTAITQPFSPGDDEQALYDGLNEYLQRDDTWAFPEQHRHLSLLIIRKLLASSSHALASTLDMIADRLDRMAKDQESQTHGGSSSGSDPLDALLAGHDIDDDLIEEILEDQDSPAEDDDLRDDGGYKDASGLTNADLASIRAERDLVRRFAGWARSVQIDEKSRALVSALAIGFERMQSMGASQKAVVFTESRRTQDYLYRFLEANGFAGDTVLFNGSNNSDQAKAIYERWRAENQSTGRSSGSRAIDTRTALIEHFRDHAKILIATEAGSEGINLQFCSLIVNYDLPWNPQRVEQRIGRVHRYGQKFDVVVINFLNSRNHADQRVFELLSEKFQLFEGVFGASDEVIGSIEAGIDFEQRVLDIYQTCRTPDEINAAFAALQAELEESIAARMADVRDAILEHFDEDVHERLKLQLDHANGLLRRTERYFWIVTKFVLAPYADFDDSSYSFVLRTSPCADVELGRYVLASQRQPGLAGRFIYRLNHPLGQWVLANAKAMPTDAATITFFPSESAVKVTRVEQLAGQAGLLAVDRMSIRGAETEEYLLVSGVMADDRSLAVEAGEKLFAVPGSMASGDATPLEMVPVLATRLEHEVARHRAAVQSRSAERTSTRFNVEREKLFRWAEDQEKAAEQELDSVKAQIGRLQREARKVDTLDAQRQIQEQIADLEKKKRRLRKEIFTIEDEIQARRDELLDALERRVEQTVTVEALFRIGWEVKE